MEPSPEEELLVYFDQMRRQQTRYLDLRRKANKALDTVNTSRPDESWDRAAKRLRDARNGYNDLAVSIGEIQPPDKLARPHRGMAQSVQLLGLYIDGVQDALDSRDVSQLVSASNNSKTSDRSIVLRANWRTAATIYAHQ
jgi:hypothetical protein